MFLERSLKGCSAILHILKRYLLYQQQPCQEAGTTGSISSSISNSRVAITVDSPEAYLEYMPFFYCSFKNTGMQTIGTAFVIESLSLIILEKKTMQRLIYSFMHWWIWASQDIINGSGRCWISNVHRKVPKSITQLEKDQFVFPGNGQVQS